jgi:Rps23 Pro-64 3,4-dihydroxylase Tpa1-like proline 4-hydroxylase
MMVTAYIEKRDPDLYLNKVLEWLNSINTHQYFKKLTENYNIKKINAQATRFLPGHYLTQHSDRHEVEGRLYAYVMGFSKNWNPAWGGLLNILDNEGKIVHTLIPEYNSLSIFKVPKEHFVSMVTPQAKTERIGITGWLLEN